MPNYLFLAFALAGATVLWRTWLNDHKSWKEAFNKLPFRIGHAFLCGSCFSYWLSLAALIIFNPFEGITLITRFDVWEIETILNFLAQWMALSWMTLIGRFGYVMIQEVVAHAVHTWRGDHTH